MSNSPLPPLAQIPPHLQTIADYEQQAQKHLPDMAAGRVYG